MNEDYRQMVESMRKMVETLPRIEVPEVVTPEVKKAIESLNEQQKDLNEALKSLQRGLDSRG